MAELDLVTEWTAQMQSFRRSDEARQKLLDVRILNFLFFFTALALERKSLDFLLVHTYFWFRMFSRNMLY